MKYEPTTWPGARLPHVWLGDGSALHDRIGDGYTLLRLAGAQADGAPLAQAFAVLCRAVYQSSTSAMTHPRDIYGYDLLLLRPDLHVVWRGNRLDDPARLAALATGHGNRRPGQRVTRTGIPYAGNLLQSGFPLARE